MSDKKILIRMGVAMHKSIALLALEKGTSRTKLMVKVLEDFINQQVKP